MYWFKLFWSVLVSVQSRNTVQFLPRSPRYGMKVSPKPTPPTVSQVRFSSMSTTTWSYLTGAAVVAPHLAALLG
jgi:hypothetical protein